MLCLTVPVRWRGLRSRYQRCGNGSTSWAPDRGKQSAGFHDLAGAAPRPDKRVRAGGRDQAGLN
jgi:hypothetical protein